MSDVKTSKVLQTTCCPKIKMHWAHKYALTHCGQVTIYGEEDLGIIGQTNGLMAISHKLNQCGLIIKLVRGIHLKVILQDVPMNLIYDILSEITQLKSLPHLPRVNELKRSRMFYSYSV